MQSEPLGSPGPRDPEPFRPELGLWSATALVVGHTIGVGIFLTPAELLGALGSPALTFGLWLACGALVLAGALTFGELARRFPQGGGPYVYLRQAWGERAAFLYGWQSLLIMDPGVTAALALGLAQYFVVLRPAAAGSERWLALCTVWALALVNMVGLRVSSRLLNLLTGIKVLALAAIAAAALTIGAGSWSHFVPLVSRRAGTPPIGEALALGLVAVFYSFGGFWEASRVAGEMRDPRRQLPRALAVGVTAVTAAYMLTTAAFLYLVPSEQATSAAAFARKAGEALLGERGPAVFASVVILSVAASAMALLLMAPRLYLAMSRDGVFPAAVAATHRVTKAPVRATALLASLASVFVLSGTFPQVVAFFLCTTLGFIALAAAGLFRIRRRAPGMRADSGLQAIPRPRRSSCSSSPPSSLWSPSRGRCRPWPASPSFCSAFRHTLFSHGGRDDVDQDHPILGGVRKTSRGRRETARALSVRVRPADDDPRGR